MKNHFDMVNERAVRIDKGVTRLETLRDHYSKNGKESVANDFSFLISDILDIMSMNVLYVGKFWETQEMLTAALKTRKGEIRSEISEVEKEMIQGIFERYDRIEELINKQIQKDRNGRN